jgi:hypothetical protein
MRNLMYLFILSLSIAVSSCSSKHPVTSVSRVPDEPDYKKDQRLNEYTYETTEESNSGATGPGTGASYGGFSSRSSSLKRDYENRHRRSLYQQYQVNPENSAQPADQWGQ